MIIGIDGNEANIQNRVGVNQYAAELLIALEKLADGVEHDWIIYLNEPPLKHLPKARDGWRYKVLPGRGFWVLRKLMPELWFGNEKPDVFLTPSHYAPPFMPMPLILSIMDLGYLRFPEQFRKYDLYQLKYWGAWSIRIAKKILAISLSTKREIAEHYPRAAGKIEVTYLGYDKDMFNPIIFKTKIQDVKKKYGINGDYILYLGTLKPNKNVEGLVGAYKIIKDENPDLKLVIAGKKGWLYETIFEKVKELGLKQDVIFTDFVPEEDKPHLLAGAKVFTNPSFWEGFGIPVLEAMAVGTPVVVSDVGSLPEVVGSAGVMVNPENAGSIATGIKSALERGDALSSKGIEQASKFSWTSTARVTLHALENLAS